MPGNALNWKWQLLTASWTFLYQELAFLVKSWKWKYPVDLLKCFLVCVLTRLDFCFGNESASLFVSYNLGLQFSARTQAWCLNLPHLNLKKLSWLQSLQTCLQESPRSRALSVSILDLLCLNCFCAVCWFVWNQLLNAWSYHEPEGRNIFTFAYRFALKLSYGLTFLKLLWTKTDCLSNFPYLAVLFAG